MRAVDNKAELRMEIFAVLTRLAKRYPQLRICQIIGNATGSTDPYYVRDGELLAGLLNYEWNSYAREQNGGDDTA
jgi:hypothetical protein